MRLLVVHNLSLQFLTTNETHIRRELFFHFFHLFGGYRPTVSGRHQHTAFARGGRKVRSIDVV